MKFSIIVPIYKVEKYINQCIESILAQTYKNFELILVNDGSPDNCPRICDEYKEKDSRVKVLHKKNGGLVSARQAGAEIAEGEFVACVDGDDYISPEYCRKVAEIIERYNPDAVIFGSVYTDGNTNICHYPDEKPGYYNKKEIEDNFFSYLIEDKNGKYFSPCIWGKVYRRELYARLQLSIDKRIKIGEDHCLTKPFIYNANSLFILNECLYYYRQNPSSMTKNRGVFDLSVPKFIANHFEKEIDVSLFDFQVQVYRHVVHDLFNASASRFNGKDGYKAAKRDIANILKDDYYRSAIKKSKFTFLSKGWFARLALRYGLYFLMFLYNKR